MRTNEATEQELIARWIDRGSLDRGRAEARLTDYGVSVWALVGALPMAGGDIDRLAEAYGLPRQAVEGALAYYRQHKALIDARLLLNADAFGL